MSKKVADPIASAEAALEVARTELAETKARLAREESMTDELVASWIESSEKDREGIERRQQSNAVAKLNLAALITKLEGNVKDKEQALREAQREAQIGVCLEHLAACASTADRIRMATREVLEAHCAYIDAKQQCEGARNALRRVCPKGNLEVLEGSEAAAMIAKGPKLAPQLRADLEVYDHAPKTLQALMSSGALEADEKGLALWIKQKAARLGIGPNPPSFGNTKVFRAGTKW